MPHKEKDLEDKLILRRYDPKRKIILCVPKDIKVNRTYSGGDDKGKLWPYAGTVPGRKHYPTDKSIPLEIYCGRKQKTKLTGTQVRIVWQNINNNSGLGTFTSVDYIVTSREGEE